MSFFTVATELHENHMMAVIPLLNFTLALDRRLWPAYAALSLTFLLNMALFDPAIVGPVSAWLGGAQLPVRGLSLAVALVNTAMFVMLWAFYLRNEKGLE
jgi:hypothetical protein